MNPEKIIEGDSDLFSHTHEHEIAPDFEAMERHFRTIRKKTFGEARLVMENRYGKESVEAWLMQRKQGP